MTVSDGLARTIVDWYSCPVPTVVHSALKPLLSGNALAERSRVPGAILFFGTAERLPFELIDDLGRAGLERSEEHTSELQSLMRISYAVFCLKKKKKNINK